MAIDDLAEKTYQQYKTEQQNYTKIKFFRKFIPYYSIPHIILSGFLVDVAAPEKKELAAVVSCYLLGTVVFINILSAFRDYGYARTMRTLEKKIAEQKYSPHYYSGLF